MGWPGRVLPSRFQDSTSKALLVICDWELDQAQKKDVVDRARIRGEEPPAELRVCIQVLKPYVMNLLQEKTHSELVALQPQIES